MQYRKYYLRPDHWGELVNQCLQLDQMCIKIVINVCSVAGARVYIPGETKIADLLRKRAYDCGAYILLV